jgi:succinate dehydrogenase / fumarate reductase, cytochrome b subunit
MSVPISSISSTFIWRRVHSLMGLWLVLYLILHLITNSQAGLWFGDDGSGFVKMVNALETMPYLHVVEIVLIGIPLLVHGVWGVKRALDARMNSSGGDGSRPGLKYERNRAFTWQRLSSWILLVGILGHVAQMRFIDAPKKAMGPEGERYFVKLSFDKGLYTLAGRLHVSLFTPEEAKSAGKQAKRMGVLPKPKLGDGVYSGDEDTARTMVQRAQEEKAWMEALGSFKLKSHQVVAVASMPGTAFLLMVRDTFKSPVMAVLYTIFLLAAAFHAFNGFWTFLITWGVILSYRSQKAMIPVSVVGMVFLSLLGLAAIWCSYWVNLRY